MYKLEQFFVEGSDRLVAGGSSYIGHSSSFSLIFAIPRAKLFVDLAR